MKSTKMQYCIKAVPSDDTFQMESLLNEMSSLGWELYTMHEVEADEGYNYNCIFVKECDNIPDTEEDDDESLFGYRSQMQKMISSQNEPYELCIEIQNKIREKRKKINNIKSLIDETNETQRQELNNEMYRTIEELKELKKQLQATISPEIMLDKIGEDKIKIRLSEENIELVNPDTDAQLVAETVRVRQNLVEELGYVIPKIRFENDETLQANEFQIDVRGVCAAKGCVFNGYYMFFKDDLNIDKPTKDMIKDNDPITGKVVYWIPSEKTKDFWAEGYDSSQVIARILEYICIKNVDEIFDYNDINNYIEIVSENNMYLIENIIPDFVSVAELKYILTSLIKERVSIKDIVYIFEKINDFADEETKEDLLSRVRHSLSRQISKGIADENNLIRAFELSEESVKYLLGKVSGKNTVIRIDNNKIKAIVNNIYASIDRQKINADEIVVIVPMEIRQVTSVVLSQHMPSVKVVAREEIANGYSIEIYDRV